MAIFTTLVAKHVNITLAQSNTYNRSGPASLKWLPLCSPARAPIARLVQVAIPRGNTEMQNVDKHGSVVLLSRLTEHKLSLSTLWSPTQSVFKPYASQFVLCHNIRPLQTTKTCTLQFSFLGLLSLSFHSFSHSSSLFSHSALLLSLSKRPHSQADNCMSAGYHTCCCQCSGVGWRRESCPLAFVTWNSLNSTFAANVNPQRSRKIMGWVCTCLVTGNPDLHL